MQILPRRRFFVYSSAASTRLVKDEIGTAPETNVPFTNVAGVPEAPAACPEAISAFTLAAYLSLSTQSLNFEVFKPRSPASLV